MEKVDISKKEIVVSGLVDYAFSEITRKYGTGNNDGETPKKYHNLRHSQEVLEAALKIAQLSLEAGKIESNDVFLLKIAASFHDIEHGLSGGNSEIESARVAEEEMIKTGIFKEEEIQKVRRLILATTIHFDENGVMRQSASEEYLTKIMADADLAYLGQEVEIYQRGVINLFAEMNRSDFERQADFLRNHKFYTEEANKLFFHKQENINLFRVKK